MKVDSFGSLFMLLVIVGASVFVLAKFIVFVVNFDRFLRALFF